MRTEIGCVALLLGAMGIVTCAAASENAACVAGKRGLSPINLATVSLTIAAVNDAPVVVDVALTTFEDTALVIDRQIIISGFHLPFSPIEPCR